MADNQQTSSQLPPDGLSALPPEITDMILKYLTETDLCHVAMVCRAWRRAANMDSLWRPLCRGRRWEHFGTSDDITKEAPYMPVSSSTDQQVADDSTSTELGANTSSNRHAQDKLDETKDGLKEDSSDEDSSDKIGSDKVRVRKDYPKPLRVLDPSVLSVYKDISFKEDCIITDSETNLVRTCRWKEIFMKARHLENNWDKQHCNVVAYDLDGLEFGNRGEAFSCSDDFLKGEKDYLVAYVVMPNYNMLKIWNIKTGTRHEINLNRELAQEDTFQIKNGIVVIGCKDGVVLAFSVSTGKELQVLKGHKATEIVDVFFDGETIVSRAKNENDIRVWSVTDGTCRHVLSSPSEETVVYNEQLDYRDNMVAAAYSDDCIRLWDTRSGECIYTLKKPEFAKNDLSWEDIYGVTGYCKLGDSTVVVGDKRQSYIWRKDSGEFVTNIPEFDPWLYCEWGLIIAVGPESIDVYNELGRHLQTTEDLVFTPEEGMPMLFHKSRCVFENYGNHVQEINLLKMTTEGLELMWRVDNEEDYSRDIHFVLMDDTKMIFCKETRYFICHFW